MEEVGIFIDILSILRPIGIFYGPLVIFCGNLVYFYPFWYVVPWKIWQHWLIRQLEPCKWKPLVKCEVNQKLGTVKKTWVEHCCSFLLASKNSTKMFQRWCTHWGLKLWEQLILKSTYVNCLLWCQRKKAYIHARVQNVKARPQASYTGIKYCPHIPRNASKKQACPEASF
jgi:hypothetical protein